MEWLTTTILLDRLQEFDDAVWEQFSGRFRGPLVDFARRMGLPDDAAQDVAQDTLIAFARAYRDGRYDRARGRLRSWLFGIAVREARRRRRVDGVPAARVAEELDLTRNAVFLAKRRVLRRLEEVCAELEGDA